MTKPTGHDKRAFTIAVRKAAREMSEAIKTQDPDKAAEAEQRVKNARAKSGVDK